MKKFIIIITLFLPQTVIGALLNLTDTPLFLGTKVDPNVFFELDDSGSMDWEILTPLHWHYCAYDPNATGSYSSSTSCGFETSNGLIRSYANYGYRYFTYIYENNDNLYSDNCYTSDYNSISSCPEAGTRDWRVYSSDLNLIYYDPGTTYLPWSGPCLTNGTRCSDANFLASRSNPREGSSGYTATKNLTDAEYHIWFDTRGYDTQDSRPYRASAVNATDTPNNQIDLWDGHIKIELGLLSTKIYKITYNPTSSGMGETNTLLGSLSNSSDCYDVLGTRENVEAVFNGTKAYDATNGEGCRSITNAKTNFANWYQYYRKRSLAAKAAISNVLSESPYNRYGLSVINRPYSLFIEVPDSSTSDYTTHNTNLLASLYGYAWDALGTPLRSGLETVGQYYDNALYGKSDPIIHECQQNFSILMTDGYWNGNNPSSSIGDADGDGISRTLADVARYYYLKDLSPLEDKVVPNPFDPATYQHMVTFTVAFGLGGNLIDTDGDGWPNPVLTENGSWGNPYYSDPAKIDDLWHAAFNSKGTYVSAKTPQAITQQLANALANIANRVSSATMAAQNSTTLQTNAYVYQARFDSSSWHGELIAYPLTLSGNVSNTPTWNANCLLTGGDCVFPTLSAANNPGKSPDQRVIITRDWTNNGTSGIPFRWPQNYSLLKVSSLLPNRITSLLSNAPYTANTINLFEIAANQTFGEKLIEYLRGDRSQEKLKGGTYQFRDRKGLLGDIINSDPLYVGPPTRYYPDSLEATPYSTFKNLYQNRDAMIFAGANDGMLHGFYASSGEEILAYVPGIREIYENLASLAQSPYAHKNFVDGVPNENDVYFNNNWHTILISGLRNGGQGLFALDITNPNNFSETNAGQILLWEFSDEDDPDLGYVYGAIPIVKVRTGTGSTKWAAIVGNGYNNSASDGYASSTGTAALFILFIDQGLDGSWTIDTDYIKLPIGPTDPSTPNGLGTPYPVDIDGDWITDYIYAGDLKGNIWKFDLRGNIPANWSNNITQFFTAYDTTLGDQPITAPLVVGPHPNGLSAGVMIYFGTGKYLEPSDNSTTGQATQAFYALWDKLDGTIPTKSALLAQSILSEISQSFDTNSDGTADTTYDLRQVSNNAINWIAPVNTGDPAQHLGWYLNLKTVGQSNQGERQITKPLLRNNNVVFTTLIPSASACDFGGSSWLMEISAKNGGEIYASPFDLNNDGIFDTLDLINLGDTDGDGKDNYTVASGKRSKVGIAATPAVFLSADKKTEYKVSNGATGLETTIENPETGPQGRQSWRQLLP